MLSLCISPIQLNQHTNLRLRSISPIAEILTPFVSIRGIRG